MIWFEPNWLKKKIGDDSWSLYSTYRASTNIHVMLAERCLPWFPGIGFQIVSHSTFTLDFPPQ